MKSIMKLDLLNRIDSILIKTKRLETQPEIFRIINLRSSMVETRKQLGGDCCTDYEFELIFMIVNLAEKTLKDHFLYHFGVEPKG